MFNFFTKKIFFLGLAGILISSLLMFALPVRAQQTCDPSLNDNIWNLMHEVSDDCYCNGNCNVCDFVAIFFQAARLILMSVSGVAMVMLIWAGVGLVMNWGNAESINKNKKLILHTFLGIIFVLAAWQLIGMIIGMFTTDWSAGTTKFNDRLAKAVKSPWSKIECQK